DGHSSTTAFQRQPRHLGLLQEYTYSTGSLRSALFFPRHAGRYHLHDYWAFAGAGIANTDVIDVSVTRRRCDGTCSAALPHSALRLRPWSSSPRDDADYRRRCRILRLSNSGRARAHTSRGGGQRMIRLEHASRWYGHVIGVNDITFELKPGLTALL